MKMGRYQTASPRGIGYDILLGILIVQIFGIPPIAINVDREVHVPHGLAVKLRLDEIGNLAKLFLEGKA